MTAGWGVDATVSNGEVTSGTTDADVRKVWGSLYSPGIISGAVVTTQPNMTYVVSAGVVAIKTAQGEVVMAPISQTQVPTAAAPASGSRVDIIYAQQRFPEIESNSEVKIGVDTVLPPRALALAKYTVSSGTTGTNGAILTGGIDYSIPYGASLGILYQYNSTYNGPVANEWRREGVGTIHLPTDRLVRFKYLGIHSSIGASGFDNSKYCELSVLPCIDDHDFELWTSPGLHQGWQSVYFETQRVVPAGTHSVSFLRFRQIGPGTVYQHCGWTNGFYRRGADFIVEDAGPVV